MSYSADLKSELMTLSEAKGCCRFARDYGLALLYGDRKQLVKDYGHDPRRPLTVEMSNIDNECCRAAFLRGVFLACGVVSDPGKGYHLALAVGSKRLSESLRDFIAGLGVDVEDFDVAPKTAQKNGAWLLYIKDSGQIEQFIAFLGAQKSYLAFMEKKVVRDVRNRINRQNNFDVANLSRMTKAAARHLQAIAVLRESGRFEALPPELRSAAELREENPEASLAELCALSADGVTRSGMNHRLTRLAAAASEEDAGTA
ncbi:MAG: DNA-binding protein WhiA [Oscillospiraceae bacterium]|jgi:DNA-binding protein WhiA|nr:DNA-binding protein WhiA [Oscillospiraceae bacterium]